ncbi:MAG: TM2 domain-containing protein, partial [Oscillospiraceae bacterium]|nr:TM2 domain-containing protein [Oscillospiraceae bacterium]
MKEKLPAGLLGIFLGAFGAHKFYLGYTKEAL